MELLPGGILIAICRHLRLKDVLSLQLTAKVLHERIQSHLNILWDTHPQIVEHGLVACSTLGKKSRQLRDCAFWTQSTGAWGELNLVVKELPASNASRWWDECNVASEEYLVEFKRAEEKDRVLLEFWVNDLPTLFRSAVQKDAFTDMAWEQFFRLFPKQFGAAKKLARVVSANEEGEKALLAHWFLFKSMDIERQLFYIDDARNGAGKICGDLCATDVGGVQLTDAQSRAIVDRFGESFKSDQCVFFRFNRIASFPRTDPYGPFYDGIGVVGPGLVYVIWNRSWTD